MTESDGEILELWRSASLLAKQLGFNICNDKHAFWIKDNNENVKYTTKKASNLLAWLEGCNSWYGYIIRRGGTSYVCDV